MIRKYTREYQVQYTQRKQSLNQLVLQTPIGQSARHKLKQKTHSLYSAIILKKFSHIIPKCKLSLNFNFKILLPSF